MKKTVFSFLPVLIVLAAVLTLTATFTADAANHLESDAIEVLINQDGSLDITETWKGDFSDSDTSENYLVKQEGTRISDFTVSMDGEAFTYDDDAGWGKSGGFDEKAGKYGIFENDDVELCWGITDHGVHTYVVHYNMAGQVHYYDNDKDPVTGMNVRFFNDGMSTGPTQVSVRIRAPRVMLDDDNATIWSFGLSGRQGFKSGEAFVTSTSGLDGDNYCTIMMAIDPDAVSAPADDTRGWSEVADAALAGSEFSADDGISWRSASRTDSAEHGSAAPETFLGKAESILPWLLGIITAFALAFTAIYVVVRKRRLSRAIKSAPEYKGLLCEGRLDAAAAIMYEIGMNAQSADIIRACTLRLMLLGSVSPHASEKDEKRMDLTILQAPDAAKYPMEADLYAILAEAAGPGGVLTQAGMKKKAIGQNLYRFAQRVPERGRNYLQTRYGETINGNPLKQTGKAKEFQDQVLGLKKYLTAEDHIAERSSAEILTWQEYMVASAILGISRRVSEEFRALKPSRGDRDSLYYSLYWYGWCNDIAISDFASAMDSYSSSSSSGGSGFSGGGSGGGSR